MAADFARAQPALHDLDSSCSDGYRLADDWMAVKCLLNKAVDDHNKRHLVVKLAMYKVCLYDILFLCFG